MTARRKPKTNPHARNHPLRQIGIDQTKIPAPEPWVDLRRHNHPVRLHRHDSRHYGRIRFNDSQPQTQRRHDAPDPATVGSLASFTSFHSKPPPEI
ncbi:MAG TPA: hypothetical protein DCS21_04250 [Gammaproteobacteria bacterium]|nr:hypothetical protein [Gammaproteobacteria bacterium]